MSEGDSDGPATCIQSLRELPSNVTKIPPVIISGVDKPKFYLFLDFSGIKTFVDALVSIIKPIKNVASGGNLFVFPLSVAQKQSILNLNSINDI